jgi:hypothetical protein
MIDSIYQLLKTIINKELRGNVSPAEFNLIAKQVQEKIFRGYFEDENRDKNKQNRGFTNKGYSNLAFVQRQRIDDFSKIETVLPIAVPDSSSAYIEYTIPTDVYLIKDRGVSLVNTVVDETESSDLSFILSSTTTSPSSTFPIYERYNDILRVYPFTDAGTSESSYPLTLRYLKLPEDPKWTYRVVSNTELFDNTQGDFQDFELHESEYSNIVIQMLGYFGVNLREVDLAQYSEILKSKQDSKEEDISGGGNTKLG